MASLSSAALAAINYRSFISCRWSSNCCWRSLSLSSAALMAASWNSPTFIDYCSTSWFTSCCCLFSSSTAQRNCCKRWLFAPPTPFSLPPVLFLVIGILVIGLLVGYCCRVGTKCSRQRIPPPKEETLSMDVLSENSQ